MTLNDDLPREYHDRQLEEIRDRVHRESIFRAFSDERERQIAKWGLDQQVHPDGTSDSEYAKDLRAYHQANCDSQRPVTWLGILLEEVYEAAAEVDREALAKELEQCGAVITNWLEDLRSRG